MSTKSPPAKFEIEVFRPGTFTAMGGQTVSYSGQDLTAIADAYDPAAAPAPVVIGHPATDAPAFAWIESLRYDGEAGRLIATVGDVVAEFAEALREKRYRTVSMALFRPDAPNNPKPGAWYAKHLGFLGAAAPAVSGLKPVELAGDDEAVCVLFAGEAIRDTASLFRRMREFLIEQFGMERADAVLPYWEIDWLDQRADEPEPQAAFAAPAQPTGDTTMTGTKEPRSKGDVTFAEKEAELARRQAELDARAEVMRKAEHEAFCESLIDEGRLLPVAKDQTIAIMEALDGQDGQVAFSDGDDAKAGAPLEAYKAQLRQAPKMVEFGAAVPPGGDGMAGRSVSFSAPDGKPVDADGLEVHGRALAYQVEHPGTEYLAAVRAVQQ